MKADLWKTLTAREGQQVAPGKVITSLFRRPAASCRGWRRACFNISRCLACWKPVRWPECATRWSEAIPANIDRGVPIPPPSPAAAAVSTAPSPTRDICLVRRQKCCVRDNWVVLSLPHDRWQSTRNPPVTLRASALILASG